jgi:hypothetical protein
MIHIDQGVTTKDDWKDYGNLGIYVDVDTSSSGFTETPHYMVSLEGNTHHWSTSGANSIYNPTPTGFRVYLRWTDDNGHYGNHNPLRINHAQTFNWHLKWTGIQT